jgi:hypothetical protein
MAARVLFILKLREVYGCGYGEVLSSGLYNSARFVVDMLNESGVESKLVQVTDNNDIDREVHAYKPTHVILEGLWVVPEKFYELMPLHPHVKWIVRIHSEIAFLAMEGIALEWIFKYVAMGVTVACNSVRMLEALDKFLPAAFLPNFYPVGMPHWHAHNRKDEIHVGCFGAIRPLKNQLTQAWAAIVFAKRSRLRLVFHMTHRDCEQGGDQVLKNLRALFHFEAQTLALHPWLDHEDFLRLLDRMDVGMQVSLSETFCIVAADMAAIGLPLVVSPEISWASDRSMCSPESVDEIANALRIVTSPWAGDLVRWENIGRLRHASNRSRGDWLKFLR